MKHGKYTKQSDEEKVKSLVLVLKSIERLWKRFVVLDEWNPKYYEKTQKEELEKFLEIQKVFKKGSEKYQSLGEDASG